MPLFLIERNFAEQSSSRKRLPTRIKLINDDVGVNWLFSFLSADKKKTYCLYEGPSAESVREAARRANIPADVVIEVSEINPAMFAQASLLHERIAQREGGGFGAVRGVGLGENAANVIRDGVRTDEESLRDLAIALARGDELQHFDLAPAQARRIVFARSRWRPIA